MCRVKSSTAGSLVIGLALFVALSIPTQVRAQEQNQGVVRPLIRGNYERVFFPEDVTRFAVGAKELLSFELLNTREALVLGKGIGRTNVVVWYSSGQLADYRFSIEEDLSVLREALRDLDPRITAGMASNRAAIVLRGIVPNAVVMERAVRVAQDYLGSRSRRARRGGRHARWTAPDELAESLRVMADAIETTEPPEGESGAVESPPTPSPMASGAVINLLRVEKPPATTEEKIIRAIEPFAGAEVAVRRVLIGAVPDDDRDVFVLEGEVANQVALVRVLSVAARMITGRSLRGRRGDNLIRVLAEEGGGLFEGGGQSGQSRRNRQNAGGGGGSIGRNAAFLQSDIETNIARAKALEVADGRILSFIEVSDLPLVRVNVRFYEVNRTAILNYSSDWAAFVSDFDQSALSAAGVAPAFQTTPARVGTSGGMDVQDVLSSIGGNLGNQFQLVDDHFAVDAAFSMLEAKGLARRLSAPSLTVLSGEQARLSIGGEIPIQEIFSPAFSGDDSPGVFGSVRFRSFGIALNMRPQIDERDMITLELAPTVSQPDQQLTSVLVDATGAEQPTTAFESRSMMTSSRLRDGQTLMLGGLVSRGDARDISQPPVIGDIPLLGWFFRSFGETDDDRELVIVVNPTIVREPIPEIGLWSFAKPIELLESAGFGGRRADGDSSESAPHQDEDGSES